MIELTDIGKTYYLGDEPLHALDRIGLRVEQGEYLSVMGPSGSGKSTLLNVLGLLEQPDSGSYSLLGQETTGLSEEERAMLRRAHVGFVFQAYHLIARLSARENVELPLTLAGMAPAERRQRVEAAMERLSIIDRAHHLPQQLSGGQRQRVAIARAIVTRPALLLADEPTGNLDSHAGAEVIALLEELNGEGITLMIVTHDARIGERACRALELVDGRIVNDTRREDECAP